MFGDSKYSNVLTIILVIVIVGIVGLLIFLGVDVYTKYYITKEAEGGVEQFNNKVSDTDVNDITDNPIDNEIDNNIQNEVINDPLANLIDSNQNQSAGNSNAGSDSNTVYYKGFVMKGTISIPKTNVNLPILAKPTKDAIEVAVAIQYGVGLNKPGNTVIIGHNYRNGLFFSNNKKLEVGDKIHIKDQTGLTLTYTIYSKFETDQGDTSFYDRETNGKCEITLPTCTDNNAERRLILLARAE